MSKAMSIIQEMNKTNSFWHQLASESDPWKKKQHIQQIAKSFSVKLGILFRCCPFSTSACEGGFSWTYLLDQVDTNAFSLIDASQLTSQLLSLKWCLDVASLSLIKVIFWSLFGWALFWVPGPKSWGRDARLASASSEFYVEDGNPCNDRYYAYIFP